MIANPLDGNSHHSVPIEIPRRSVGIFDSRDIVNVYTKHSNLHVDISVSAILKTDADLQTKWMV